MPVKAFPVKPLQGFINIKQCQPSRFQTLILINKSKCSFFLTIKFRVNLANQSCRWFFHSCQTVDRMSSCTLSVTLKVKVQVLYTDTHLYSDLLSPLPAGPQSKFPGWKTSLCPVGTEGYPESYQHVLTLFGSWWFVWITGYVKPL